MATSQSMPISRWLAVGRERTVQAGQIDGSGGTASSIGYPRRTRASGGWKGNRRCGDACRTSVSCKVKIVKKHGALHGPSWVDEARNVSRLVLTSLPQNRSSWRRITSSR